MSKRKRYTVDEAADLIDDDDDLADIQASDFIDTASEDGDVEEADYVSASGEAELVSHRLLSSGMSAIMEDAEEPALRDSLLLLDSDLGEIDDPMSESMDETGEVDDVSDVCTDSPVSDAESSNEANSSASESEATNSSPSTRGRGYRQSSRIGRGRVRGSGRGMHRGRRARAGRVRGGRVRSGRVRGGRVRGGRVRGGRVRGGRVRGGRVRGGRVRGGRVRGSRARGRAGRARAGRSVTDEWKWSTTFSDDPSISSPPIFSQQCGPSEAHNCDEPDDFFRLLFTDELVSSIVDNTNLYASQKGFNITFSREDILSYIGMNIAMGIVDLPEISDYWTQEAMLRSLWFPSVMTKKRFKALSRFIHFADNSAALSRDDPLYDRLWKIRPVIESVQKQSQDSYTPGEHVSVDESMIGTKGRLSFLQYMPKKPTKWGIKVWVCSESKTGYIHKFQVYTGKSDVCSNGLPYGMVMHLMEDLQEEGRMLYVDNFYTSPILFEHLYERGTFASGTIRVNRKHFPAKDLDQVVMCTGEMAFLHHGCFTAGKWRDKRDVYFLSTIHRDERETITRRAKGGGTETVAKPRIVTDYNEYMSGVDISDQLMVYYACGRRTLKWYKRVFWRLIEHILINSYILFKQVTKPNLRQWTQKKFRIELAYKLTATLIANRIGQGRSPASLTLERLKGKHFAYYHETRGRYVVCAYKRQRTNSNKRKDTKTKNYCPKCDVHVCHGICFEKYHTLVKY